MIKKNVKKLAIPTIYLLAFGIIVISTILIGKSINKYMKQNQNFNYVNRSIIETVIPTMEEKTNIIKPYTNEKVSIGKYFYDYEANKEEQEKSIIFYENTYLQNSGVDYVNNEKFEIVSVLKGNVINVKEDKILGNIVEIKHENDFITIYQGIEDVIVKKDQAINQGDTIGTSGSNDINRDYPFSFHFEVFNKGKLMDPENFYNTNLKDLN